MHNFFNLKFNSSFFHHSDGHLSDDFFSNNLLLVFRHLNSFLDNFIHRFLYFNIDIPYCFDLLDDLFDDWYLNFPEDLYNLFPDDFLFHNFLHKLRHFNNFFNDSRDNHHFFNYLLDLHHSRHFHHFLDYFLNLNRYLFNSVDNCWHFHNFFLNVLDCLRDINVDVDEFLDLNYHRLFYNEWNVDSDFFDMNWLYSLNDNLLDNNFLDDRYLFDYWYLDVFFNDLRHFFDNLDNSGFNSLNLFNDLLHN